MPKSPTSNKMFSNVLLKHMLFWSHKNLWPISHLSSRQLPCGNVIDTQLKIKTAKRGGQFQVHNVLESLHNEAQCVLLRFVSK